VFQVPGDGTREHYTLQVSAFANQVFHLLAMRDAHYVLLDDRAIVQDCRHVVAGGADQFDAAVKRGVVGTRSDESRQEGMVHVDDSRGILLRRSPADSICM
jgi:hypothetical protein